LAARPAEIRRFLNVELDPGRTRKLADRMRAVGLDAGADVNAQSSTDAATSLHEAIGGGKWKMMDILLERGRTGADLLDRLTHHVHILEMNGESFRLNHSHARKTAPTG